MRGEVTIGIVLTLLLISGRNDPQALAFSLGGIGVFLLLQGFIPLSRRGPGRAQAAAKAEKTVLRDDTALRAVLQQTLRPQMSGQRRPLPAHVQRNHSIAANTSPALQSRAS